MIALDTNVLVRLLTNDEPGQARRAAALIEKHPVFVPKSVLLETEWVLRHAYGLGRPAIHAAFEKLLGLPQLAVEHSGAVREALEAYAAGLDFADALHMASSRMAERFVTFDQHLIKKAGRLPGLMPLAEP